MDDELAIGMSDRIGAIGRQPGEAFAATAVAGRVGPVQRAAAGGGTVAQRAESRPSASFEGGFDGAADGDRGFLQALTRHLRGCVRRRIPQPNERRVPRAPRCAWRRAYGDLRAASCVSARGPDRRTARGHGSAAPVTRAGRAR